LRQFEDGAVSLLDTDDVAHHQRLFLVLAVVGLASALGLWVGQRSINSIAAPIRGLGAHLAHVAQGDFANRVAAGGPRELQQLADDVNGMTADLERLHEVERTGFQEQLWHQAFHDPLACRTALCSAIGWRMRSTVPIDTPSRVLVLDIDNFKVVNDGLGHADALRQSVQLDGRQVVTSASIGIALSRPRNKPAEALLRDADLAMYRAKSNGKARWQLFDDTLESQAMERLEVETDLRHLRAADASRGVGLRPGTGLHVRPPQPA
jgi:GGDEF domain-containing protein